MHSRMAKLAAAAALVLAVLLLARHLTGRETPAGTADKKDSLAQVPDKEVVPVQAAPARMTLQELEQITARELFARADTRRLLQLLDTGLDQTKIAAANYLAQVGDESAVPALEKLAAQWTGPADENPFRKSIEQIRSRSPRPEKTSVGSQSREQTPANPAADTKRGPTITVHVSEKATGAPVPNAALQFRLGGAWQTDACDEGGTFVVNLGESLPDLIVISARPEGYVWQGVDLRSPTRQNLPQTIQFSLEKGTVIGGLVRDEAGRPVPDATVEAYIPYFPERQKFNQPYVIVAFKETTDAQGRWRSGGVPTRLDSLWFALSHAQFAEGSFEMRKDLQFDDLRAQRAVMVLKEGVTVTGWVADAVGNPIAGAELLAGQDYFARDRVTTDAAGHFELPHLRTLSASLLLTVQASGFAAQRRELPSEKGLAPVPFVLQPAKLLLGRVVDRAGSPVEGVYVAAERWNLHRTLRWSSRTDAEGEFVWDYAPADAVEIRIEKEGYRTIWPEVVANNQEQTFVLAKPMTIQGAVTDSQTGKPIGRFKLIPGLESAGGNLAKWQVTDNWTRWFMDGRYSYTFSADAQAYGVRIEAEGYLPVESRFVDANEVGATIDVTLTRSEGPSGYVFDAEARPVAGVEVCWASRASIQNGQVLNTDGVTRTTTGSEGRFVFPADGQQKSLLLVLCDQGVGMVSREEFAKTGVVTLTPWARVQGDLRLGRQPGAGRQLQLTCYGKLVPNSISIRSETTTNENGRFVFERVCPGDFMLYDRVYQVLPGQTLELHLGGTGRTVKGQLVLPGLANTPVWNDLVVRPSVDIPFDQFPKPPRYEQMSLEEVRAWFSQWAESQEGMAYRAWLMQMYPQIGKGSLPVETDGPVAFHVDNVMPGTYAVKGVLRRSPTHGSPQGNEILGRFWHKFEVPPLLRETDLDVPLDLGAVTVLPGELKPGDPAPDFDVPTFGPDRVRLRDYRGKVLLVSFHDSEDAGNRSSGLEDLKATYRRFRADPRYAQVSLLYSSFHPLDKKAIEAAGLDWPYGLVDYDGKESTEYSVPGTLMHSILIGSRGEVLAVGLSGAALTQAVEQVLVSGSR